MFTVQVQPQYPMSPQTMQGGPVTPPGMPGNLNDQQEKMGDMEQADEGGDGLPFDDGDVSVEEDPDENGGFDDDEEEEAPDDVAAEGDKDDSPFPPKQSFLTQTGAALTEDQYIRHLAIKFSPNRIRTLARIREEMEGR